MLKANQRGSYAIDDNVNLFKTDLSVATSSVKEVQRIPAVRQSPKLSAIEEMSLYNLAGYCIKQFTKLNRNCDNCLQFLTTKERPAFSNFTSEKCYKLDALTYASRSVFELLTVAEQILVDFGDVALSSPSVLIRLMFEAKHRCEQLQFPTCHQPKERLLQRYFRVRMFSFIKSKKGQLKKQQHKQLKSETTSSRSMAMRENVKMIHVGDAAVIAKLNLPTIPPVRFSSTSTHFPKIQVASNTSTHFPKIQVALKTSTHFPKIQVASNTSTHFPKI
jgi:hypothetical protein